MFMNVRILSVSIPISLFIFCSVFVLAHHFTQPDAIDCSGQVNLEIKNNINNLKGDVYISAHIIPESGERSYVSERGYFLLGSQRFIVDRHVRLLFNDVNDNGFSEVTVEGIDKAPGDTLPEALYNKIYASQTMFYYKFEKIQSHLWRWRDLRRTLLMCKVIA